MRLGEETGQDLYAVLGVERNATREQIRQAHHRLALRFHPDRVRCDQARAEERMKKINVAATVLLDSEARREYDWRHGRGPTPAPSPPAPGSTGPTWPFTNNAAPWNPAEHSWEPSHDSPPREWNLARAIAVVELIATLTLAIGAAASGKLGVQSSYGPPYSRPADLDLVRWRPQLDWPQEVDGGDSGAAIDTWLKDWEKLERERLDAEHARRRRQRRNRLADAAKRGPGWWSQRELAPLSSSIGPPKSMGLSSTAAGRGPRVVPEMRAARSFEPETAFGVESIRVPIRPAGRPFRWSETDGILASPFHEQLHLQAE